MRRPMRWYWAALCSVAAYIVAVVASALLVLGYGGSWLNGPLLGAINTIYEALARYVGHAAGDYVILVALTVPAGLVAVATYGLLRRREDDGYLHCLKCGYILKGISEPRCPECGEVI